MISFINHEILKKYYALIIPIIIVCQSSAQKTIPKKNRLTETITEYYNVLKDSDQVKDGEYRAFYLKNVVIARGKYANNQKTGIWYFYDTHQKTIQVFNYTENKLIYEEPVDSSRQYIQYLFDRKFKNNDRLTKPIRIGGRSYGYIPYLKFFHLSDDYDYWEQYYYAVLELLISPGGRLADVKIHIKTNALDRVTTFSPDIFSEEDKQFIPATLNGEPILSRIFLQLRVTDKGTLDIY